MHLFSDQFPITWEKTAKPNEWESLGNWFLRISYKTHRIGKTWKIGAYTFDIVWVTFSIRFPSCGILHQMGNAWMFSSVSQSMVKSRKIHRMGKDWKIISRENSTKTHRMLRSWEIDTHNFPIVLVAFPR